jgi:uncharacterized membrane protein
MSDLIVATFADPQTADKAMQALREIEKEALAEIDDAAIVRKDADGKVRVKSSLDESTIGGALVGAILGGVLSIFLPIVGLVAGAIGGAVVGRSLGNHLDKSFIDDVSRQLDAGQSALFVLLRAAHVDAVVAALRPIEGGTLLQTTVDPDLERELAEALK